MNAWILYIDLDLECVFCGLFLNDHNS